MVSDESLRIREGLVRVPEQTMTVANIQNMRISQGPLQRLFGLAEFEVHTAGGGGKATEDDKSATRNLHVGHFRGLGDFAPRFARTTDGQTGVCARTRPAERTVCKRG